MFYLNLYASSDKQDFSREFIKKVNLPNLDIKDDDFSLGDLISEKECYETITTFKNDKSPVSHGQPIYFYKSFWYDIKDLLCSVHNSSLLDNILPLSLRRSIIITLLPKKGRDLLLLKTWRPISLLNRDYKILAKILSLQMKKVLGLLISNDQYGLIKERLPERIYD